MQPSLLNSALRAFIVTFFAIIGFFFALFLFIIVIQAVEKSEDEVRSEYALTIRPNAEGVRKKVSKTAPVILELGINGVIGSMELNQQKIETLLLESRENSLADDRVKAILLHINSPGGTVNDADGIYRALLDYKARHNVPIFAYTDGICASGGMYVACAADEIYSAPATLIGSVGVISPPFMNLSQLLDKIGVFSLTLYAGKGKDDLNPLRPWKQDEEKPIQKIIEHYYEDFVDIVVKHRPKMDKQKLVEVYGANVFPASIATEYGYVDGAGYSRDAVLKKLLTKLSIDDDYYQVVRLESSDWLSQLFKAESPLFTGKIRHEFNIYGNIPAHMADQPLYLYQP